MLNTKVESENTPASAPESMATPRVSL